MTTYNLTLNLKKEAYGETIINYFNNNVENFTNLHFYQYGGIDTDTTDNRFYDMAFDYVTVTIKTKKSIDFLLNFFESIEINSKNEEVEILETYNSQNEELESVEFSNEIIYMDEEEEEEFEAKDLLEFNALLNAKDLKPDTSENLKPGKDDKNLFEVIKELEIMIDYSKVSFNEIKDFILKLSDKFKIKQVFNKENIMTATYQCNTDISDYQLKWFVLKIDNFKRSKGFNALYNIYNIEKYV